MEQHGMIKAAQVTTVPRNLRQAFSASLNEPFPFYLNDDKKNFLLVFVISIFVTGFLYVFRTPDEHHFSDGYQWMHGTITFGSLLFNVIVLPRIFPALMDPVAWTWKKYIILNFAHLVLIWAACTAIEKPLICPDLSWVQVGSHVATQVALKGIIPIALTTLFLKTHLLQKNLEEAITTNRELQKIRQLKKDNPKTDNEVTLYSDTSETATFNLPDLLFVEADDNYSTVYWRNNEGLHKKLLRLNLKSVESQLNNSFALRCHRSFIVNIYAIAAISGNTNGYKLRIRDMDISIPVSRPKGKEVIDKISQLRNMMELA
jgi:hypothetical protein